MVRIGPAGWQYKDWNGIVYPAPKPRGFDPLAYLAQYFNTIEINTSFYGPPRPTSSQKWVESVSGNPKFRFTAKLYKAFTHERKPTADDERDFKAGMEPIAAADRLGAILLQFPWSFKAEDENCSYLSTLIRRFREYPLAEPAHRVPPCAHLRCSIKHNCLEMFAGTDLGGLILLRHNRRSRGVYWPIFAPALIERVDGGQR